MKQKYKKLAFFILLLSMLTGCMLLSGCMENTEKWITEQLYCRFG